MKDFVKLVEAHWDGIVGGHDSRVSNGLLEGTSSLIQAAKARARGYRRKTKSCRSKPRSRKTTWRPERVHLQGHTSLRRVASGRDFKAPGCKLVDHFSSVRHSNERKQEPTQRPKYEIRPKGRGRVGPPTCASFHIWP